MKTDSSRRQFLAAGSTALGSLAALTGFAAADTSTPVSESSAARTSSSFRFDYALNTGTIRGQKLSLPEQVEVTARAGYQGIEPWTGDISRFLNSGGSLKDLARRCADLGLKVVSAIGFASWIVNDDQQRAKGVEQMRREMEMLAELGGTHIAAPPAGAHRAGNPIHLDQAADRYRAILEIGHEIGVVPQVEVWGSSANLSHVAEAIYVAAKSGHPEACVLADAFHMYKADCPPAVLRFLSRRTVHCFHMNDYPASPPRGQIKDSERIWPGDGIAPLREILKILAANHCQVMLSLELFNPDYWNLPALEAARTGLAKMKGCVAAAGLS